ncbi:MAG: laminin B domain-containing protein [Gelidibacter sp.]
MKHLITFLKPLFLSLFGLIIFTGCNSKNYIIKSDFATNTEGWTITGDAQGEFSEPSYATEGGVTDGYIFADDDVQGGVWYFTAPDTYLGNKNEFYGATLRFSLLQESKMSRQFVSDDIIFQNGNNQITYIFDKENYPGKNWTEYEVKISADQGWFKGGYNSKVQATEAEIKAILSNITQFSIRGEFETGPDTGALDHVIISKK